MKKALGLGDIGGFPYQLSLLKTKVSLPIPAEPFNGKAPSLKKIFNADMKIYVTPDEYFTTKFREIFQKTKLRHTSAAESKHWSGRPDMKYWPQQLNFGVLCTTQGCGISREKFDSGIDPWGGTPLYGLCRYVRPQRVWFFSLFSHKLGIDFSHFAAILVINRVSIFALKSSIWFFF